MVTVEMLCAELIEKVGPKAEVFVDGEAFGCWIFEPKTGEHGIVSLLPESYQERIEDSNCMEPEA